MSNGRCAGSERNYDAEVCAVGLDSVFARSKGRPHGQASRQREREEGEISKCQSIQTAKGDRSKCHSRVSERDENERV